MARASSSHRSVGAKVAAALALFTAGAPSGAHAEQLTLSASAVPATLVDDVSITSTSQPYSEVNYNGAGLVAREGPSPRVALMFWDTSGVVENAAYVDAELQLAFTTPATGVCTVHALLRPFDQVQATWSRATATQAWSQPGLLAGADYDPTPLATFDGTAPSVPFNDAGDALVAEWIARTKPNYGLVALHAGTGEIRWWDSEASVASDRPALVIHLNLKDLVLQEGYRGGNGIAQDVFLAGPDAPTPGTTPDETTLRAGLAGAAQSTALVRWHLPRPFPADVIVQSAVLQVSALSTWSSGFQVRGLLRSWSEAATWSTADGATAWNAPGATSDLDRAPTPLGVLGPVTSVGQVASALNTQGVEWVRRWMSGEAENHGLAFQLESATDELRIASSETLAGPALVVTFDRPTASLAFTPAEAAATVAQVLGPLTVGRLDALGAPAVAGQASLQLTSSASTGRFAADPAGPWGALFAVALGEGQDSTRYYYRDDAEGTATVTASLTDPRGTLTRTQQIAVSATPVNPSPAVALQLEPEAVPTPRGGRALVLARVQAGATPPSEGRLECTAVGLVLSAASSPVALGALEPGGERVLPLLVDVTGAPGTVAELSCAVREGELTLATDTAQLEIGPATLATGCGCATAGGGPFALALAMLVKALRRRRPSPRAGPDRRLA